MPPGFENLRGDEDMIRALAELRLLHPSLERAVIKLEEGFSGEGNAIFSYDGAPAGAGATRVGTRRPADSRPLRGGRRALGDLSQRAGSR